MGTSMPDIATSKRITDDSVREMAFSLPGVEEKPSCGTPGFRVSGKLFARLHQDGESLVVKIGFEERDLLMQSDPEVYYITDHYRGYPAVLVRLSRVDADDLRDLLEQAWRQGASRQLIASYDSHS